MCGDEFPIKDFKLHKYYTVPGDLSSLRLYPSSICKVCARDQRAEERNGSFRGRLYVVLKGAKNRAKEHSLECDIDLEFLLDLLRRQEMRCHYTGRHMTCSSGSDKVSIDRKDSRLGYTRSNVVLCCWLVNRLKQELSDAEFVSVCNEVTIWKSISSVVSEKVSAQNYPSFAGRTERVPEGDTEVRSPLVVPLIGAFECLRKMGEAVDTLKRDIYYGKQSNAIDILAKLPDFSSLEMRLKFPAKLMLDPVQYRMMHAAMGMITEAIEFMETVVDNINGSKPIDVVNVMEEIGDQQWYQAIPMNIFGLKPEQCMVANIAKLLARYPDKFSLEKAVNRDLNAERAVLESHSGAESPAATTP